MAALLTGAAIFLSRGREMALLSVLRQSSRLGLAVAVLTLIASTAAAGGGLFAPISMDSAAVMPKGVRNLRLGGFTTQVTDKFDGYGSIVPSANAFNRSVTLSKLISSRPDAFERGQLKGGLKAEGYDSSMVVGDARGLVNARITSQIPVLAYGITDKVTFGMGLPIVSSYSHVDTGWIANQGFQNMVDDLQKRGYEPKLLALKALLNDVVATQIASYGYKPLEDEKHTDIGDLNVGFKEQIYKSDDVAVAVAQKLVVPTGRTPDVDKVVDLAPGDGHFALGLSTAADFRAADWLTVTPSAGYLYQFENTQAARIPRTSDESISPDTDPSVRVKRGDIMSSALALKFPVTEVLTPAVAYSLQYKNADSYEGGAYSPERYRFLENDTWQSLQTAQVALTASTIALFKKQKFPLPLEATLAWAHVIDGRNVGKFDVAIFDLAAFF